MAQRPARWSRLARRAGRDLSCLPSRRFRELRERKDMRHHLRRRLSGIMVAPVEALAQMPESLDTAEAAPLMCAGVTTFNSLRHSGALPSDLVAVQGIGGLGHLGVQFAKKFGYRVAAGWGGLGDPPPPPKNRGDGKGQPFKPHPASPPISPFSFKKKKKQKMWMSSLLA